MYVCHKSVAELQKKGWKLVSERNGDKVYHRESKMGPMKDSAIVVRNSSTIISNHHHYQHQSHHQPHRRHHQLITTTIIINIINSSSSVVYVLPSPSCLQCEIEGDAQKMVNIMWSDLERLKKSTDHLEELKANGS